MAPETDRAHALLDELVQRTERVHELQHELQRALVAQLATPPIREARAARSGEPSPGLGLDVPLFAAATHPAPVRSASGSSTPRPLSEGGEPKSHERLDDVVYSPLGSRSSSPHEGSAPHGGAR